MSPQHVLFIPATFLLGMLLGWVWGQKAALAQLARQAQARKR